MVTVDGSELDQHEVDFVEGTVRRWLSVEWDPRPAVRVAAAIDSNVATFISLEAADSSDAAPSTRIL